MSVRSFFRAIGWLTAELVPGQAVRVARGRDFDAAVRRAGVAARDAFADALAEAEAEEEVWEPREQCLGCGDAKTDSHVCLRAASVVSEDQADACGGAGPLASAPASPPSVEPLCRQISPDRDSLLPYRCSLELGHEGNHVAWGGKLPIAAWAEGSRFVYDPHDSAVPAADTPAPVESFPPTPGAGDPFSSSAEVEAAHTPSAEDHHEITIHRSELIPGGMGALIGYSDDFPGKQFLIIPQK